MIFAQDFLEDGRREGVKPDEARFASVKGGFLRLEDLLHQRVDGSRDDEVDSSLVLV